MRVGVVGCGLIGRRRAEVVKRRSQDRLVIVADSISSRAESLASAMGCAFSERWRSVVEHPEVDAVVVSTSNNWLAPVTIAALRAGKHVLCEKPLGRNEREARAMVDAASAAGRKLKTGFNHRYHPGVWKAHQLFLQGEIGRALFIRCRYGHGARPGYQNEWRCDPEVSGGGEMLDQGIHAVDLFRWFLGDFVEAFGMIAPYVWIREGAGSNQVEDNVFALFRTVEGQVASLHASWTQWKNIFCFEIAGDRGYLVVEGLGGSYGVERLTVGKRNLAGGAPSEETLTFEQPDDSWEAEWREFSAAIANGHEPLASGYDGWQAMRMVAAVYESARTGAKVTLAEPTT